MQKKIFGALLILLLGLIANIAIAQEEINEDELFSDEESIVAIEEVVDDSISSNMESQSVDFSGNIASKNGYYMTQKWLAGETDGSTNMLSMTFEADFLLDVRLLKGVKAFIDLGVGYTPIGVVSTTVTSNDTTNDTILLIKELFIDANIKNVVYLKMGKQVLQWGRGYLWNPTDLINKNKKSFLEMDALREGIYGVKVHIPYKTIFNFYGFIDATDVEKIDEFGVAGKAELLIGRTEFSLSAWAKKDFLPVYGFDFSTRLGSFDIHGEMSLSYGENRQHLGEEEITTIPMPPMTITNYPIEQTTNKWIPIISLGFSKSFDWDIEDRITLNFEFLYNHSGYYDNVFDNQTKLGYLMMNNLYVANFHSVYYGALFVSMQRFFIEELTFSANAIINMTDWSAILIGTVNYTPTYNFTISFGLQGFVGGENKEYTIQGIGLSQQLNLTLKF